MAKDGEYKYSIDENGAYTMAWNIRINYALDNNGKVGVYNNLIVEDRLKLLTETPSHEYVMVNGVPKFVLREYVGNNFAADIQDGSAFNDLSKFKVYTNSVSYSSTRPHAIFDITNIKGIPLTEFIKLSNNNNSAAFDFGVAFGVVDKPYSLSITTKTTPEFSYPNYDLNDKTVWYAQSQMLHDSIRNELYIEGSYKHGVFISIPTLVNGSNSVGDNYGKLTINKVSDSLIPPTLIVKEQQSLIYIRKLLMVITSGQRFMKLH